MTEPADVRATRTAYDTVATSYADLLRDELASKPLDRGLLGVFVELLPGGGTATVADLGCGPGRVTAHLHGGRGRRTGERARDPVAALTDSRVRRGD